MAVPRGVTFTLSDYRTLGPPFPGGYILAVSPFWGDLALGSSFSPFISFQFSNLFFQPPGNDGLKMFKLVPFFFRPYFIPLLSLLVFSGF